MAKLAHFDGFINKVIFKNVMHDKYLINIKLKCSYLY